MRPSSITMIVLFQFVVAVLCVLNIFEVDYIGWFKGLDSVGIVDHVRTFLFF